MDKVNRPNSYLDYLSYICNDTMIKDQRYFITEDFEIKIERATCDIIYVASDNARFTDFGLYTEYEENLRLMRLEWYNKRFSLWGDIMYFLFKKEPVKPYDF